jgi:hypothetical protein
MERRVEEYQLAYNIYVNNLLAFRHMLIYSALSENIYSQMLRLFQAYEGGEL